jgi:microcystin degradation protein MlrC
MIRIALGGLMHESNTFAETRTDLDAFEAGGLETGRGIFDRWGEAHHEVGGFLEGASRYGFEPVPTLMGWATPAGPLTGDTYFELTDRLLAAIRGAGRVDAVLLALHGAMVAEGEPDADGTLLMRVRELIGRHCPLIATHDYHANISPRAVEASDALIGYRTYPHIDQRSRGLKAAAIATRTASSQIRPTQALSKPPLLVNILAQETGREPMLTLMRELERLDEASVALDASIFAGFPYADVAANGPACVVVTDDDPALASETAELLSARLWGVRHALTITPPPVELAVSRALAATRTPVVLVDLGDNIGGGSAADSTVVIHELLRQGATDTMVVLHDPDSVRICKDAGPGREVTLDVGGKRDRNAPPLALTGRVLVAVVETAVRNTVVLTSLRHPPFSLGQLTSLGLDPASSRVIVVKAAVAYKAAYAPLAPTIIEVDTPGLTSVNPTRFAYRNIRRPILPLDSEGLVEATFSRGGPAPG